MKLVRVSGPSVMGRGEASGKIRGGLSGQITFALKPKL